MSVESSVLANGLRVVTHSMPHLETVSLGVWVNAGARSEAKHEHGISHLLEHMAFKGTPAHSALDIAEKIENVGGDLNAATSLEMTTYYARVLKEDTGLAIGLLSDILQNPLFEKEELIREREVILQEIAACQDSPDDVVYDLLLETAFPDQSLGRSILGTSESVVGHEPKHLRDYLERQYTADRMVLSAAGCIDHEGIVALAQEYFSGLDGNRTRTFDPSQYSGGVQRSEKQFEQCHIVLGFEGVTNSDEDFYTSHLLSNLLGGGMSSRLFQEIRERRGLCYSIDVFSWNFADTGLFGIHAATGSEQVPELIDVTRDLLLQICNDPPTDAEMNRLKAQLKAGLLMSLESSSARADQIARQMIAFGRPIPVDELLARVEAVDGEMVRNLAARIFCQSPPSCVSLGPLLKPEHVDDLAQFLR